MGLKSRMGVCVVMGEVFCWGQCFLKEFTSVAKVAIFDRKSKPNMAISQT